LETGVPSLGESARVFVRYPSVRLLAPLVAATWALRLWLGGWHWTDALPPLVILALEPFTEWVVHVSLLHWRPRRVWRWTLDPLAARKHRAHHADPRDLGLVFVPMPVLVVSVVTGAVLYALVLPTARLAVTTAASAYTMLFAYEWTHYLIHTSYRPKTRAYRYVWRAHRLHHFRNERYWFGVTMHLADHVLGTFPEKDAVPVSPTARTLGVGA
jgi:hypothetical protein